MDVTDDTVKPLAERKADILDWIINNLLTDSQLDVIPPGMSGPLRFGLNPKRNSFGN